MNGFLSILQEYIRLGIPEQIDYKKFYLYSLITHSTAIEGSTVTEIENQLLFDEGITAPGRTLQEQMMNLDLKRAYEQGQSLAEHIHPWSDGNGRMARLVMNMLQWEYNLIPVKVLNEQKAPYIQSLVDTREQEDESIFTKAMFAIHQQNLSAEIVAFNASMQSNVTQKLTDRQKDILHLIATDNTISANTMATIHGITVRSVRRDIDALRQYYNIQWVGPSKGGHWEIIEN